MYASQKSAAALAAGKPLVDASGKELKPTLSSGPVRTRKRNIQTKRDPEAFRNRLLEVFDEAEGDVKKLVQLLDNDSLDYSRYGDVFGEVILAGNIVEPGGSLRSAPTPHCVFESETEENATIGVEAMHQIMRRKPFLRARFDAVVSKLLICLSTFGDVERDRFAFAVGLMLSRNMISPSVLNQLKTNKTAVESGHALAFMIRLITCYLEAPLMTVDKLMGSLKSANIDTGTMVDLMPTGDRSADALSQHFRELGLGKLVEQNERRIKQAKVTDAVAAVCARVRAGVPGAETYAWVAGHAKDVGLSEAEVVGAVWGGIVDSVDLSRKQQQNRTSLLGAFSASAGLLNAACKNGQAELELLSRIQTFVSADMEFLKLAVFRDIVTLLYRKDVLSEDAIQRWYSRGSTLNKGSAASSNIIRMQMQPFVKWLETAEEESSEEEGAAPAAPAEDATPAADADAAPAAADGAAA
ncbi:hypothetical protein I4F81_005174 [Pyropia yezoensis]|uniref:Uncharacterized protein n=1 Tax=Pyropia yezoensis TaxID=2788 RepID=A0ACC3BX29_PYRYE|nr:hypothetical protein I4F81_005174 [Neopyropia yezoensis]|eukprot:contig_14321_g3435